jgi:SAM-dependent methyltransferase
LSVSRRTWRTLPPDPYVRMEADRALELGCGSNKLRPDAIGVDVLHLPGVDVVGDIPAVLGAFDDSSIDVIFSNHFLEHAGPMPEVMAECARLLRPGGRFIAVVPHFSSPYYYSDPTHRTMFGLYTMSYFAFDPIHRRAVPRYVNSDDEVAFRLLSASHRFEQSLRRPVSYLLARCLGFLCGRSTRWAEFYEYRLTWLFPCMEIRFELERISSP